jgi:hypothetical protein
VLQGVDIDFTNVTADGTNAAYGIHLNDFAATTASAEYGIYVQGTNWDYSVVTEGDMFLNNAGAELVILESTGATYYGTIDVGDLSANATYTLSGPSGNILTSTTEPVLTTTGRHTRVLEFKPEFAGATLTTYYGAGTDTSITGSMTADVETDNPLHNFYEWSSSETSALNGYTVSFSVALPSDFDSWATSSAIQMVFKTETANDTDNELEFYIYDATDSLVASSTSGNAATSWSTVTIDDSVLTGWATANSTAFIFIRMRSKNDYYARAGEIKLTYLSKW